MFKLDQHRPTYRLRGPGAHMTGLLLTSDQSSFNVTWVMLEQLEMQWFLCAITFNLGRVYPHSFNLFVQELRKRLIGMNLKPGKIKTVQKNNFAFVNFRLVGCSAVVLPMRYFVSECVFVVVKWCTITFERNVGLLSFELTVF